MCLYNILPKCKSDKISISLNQVKNSKEFSHYKEFEILGSGCNATVFKAKHKVTEQSVVIKVYKIFRDNEESYKDKHLKEIKKNAKINLTKYNHAVFDAGTVSVDCFKYLYCIMNYLDGITLEEWLQKIKSLEKRLIKPIEINAALGFLYYCYNLVDNDCGEITHGDINVGNVIFLKQNSINNKNDFLNYCSCGGNYLVPTKIELIDYGTSEWEETTHNFGIERDLNFIVNNTCKILSSYPIKEFINYDAMRENEELHIQRNILIVDLIRIILSIDYLDNLCYAGGRKKDYSDWLYRLWNCRFKREDKLEFNNFIDLNYWSALKQPSTGKYINKTEIVNYMNKQKKQCYTIKLTNVCSHTCNYDDPDIKFKW